MGAGLAAAMLEPRAAWAPHGMAGRAEESSEVFPSDNSYGSARCSVGTSARAGPHSTSVGTGAAIRAEVSSPPAPNRLPRPSPVTWGGLTTACLRKGSLSPNGMMLLGLPPWWESSSSSEEPSVPEKPFSCLLGCTPFTTGAAISLAGELGGSGSG